MLIDVTEALIISAGTGVATAIATVAAVRVDIGWLKNVVTRAHSRIDAVETRVGALESRCASRHGERVADR